MRNNSWIPVVGFLVLIVAVVAVVVDNISLNTSKPENPAQKAVSDKPVSALAVPETVTDSHLSAKYSRREKGVLLEISSNNQQSLFYWAGPVTWSYPPKNIQLTLDSTGQYKARIEFNGSDSVLSGGWCAWVVFDGRIELVSELPSETGEPANCPEFPK
jgi:hypothetical protein